ncbi:MAG TPA: glutamate--tRNA ligase [Candidatus Paceibacterota bacterium]
MEKKDIVIVRFPPSPTGFLQMGNVRTLIYNYLFAKKHGGKFLVRIEDTDKVRSTKEYEDAIFSDLEWLGLDYDNKQEVWRSSERNDVYKSKIQELLKNGSAYISEETEGENKEVVRFKNPGGKIKFHDLIRGDIEIDVNDLGDFIIARNINDPLYHLAVCIDDVESGITHIIRGDDHISNTPRQILILEALGGKRPIYAHLPLVLAPDKSKLSKRKHGESVSLKYYKEKGYEPQAVLNFLALIGWNPGTDQEIFTLEELVKAFDLSKVQKKGGIFNVEKLDWVNREHILHTPLKSQISNLKSEINKTKFQNHQKISDGEFIEKFLKIILDRVHRWGEVSELLEAGEFDYLFETPVLDPEKITWKNQTKEEAKNNLEQLLKILAPSPLQGEARPPGRHVGRGIRGEVEKFAEKEGKGETLWPLRYSLSGKEKSPDPFTLIQILGKQETIDRIQNAIETLK